MVSKLK